MRLLVDATCLVCQCRSCRFPFSQRRFIFAGLGLGRNNERLGKSSFLMFGPHTPIGGTASENNLRVSKSANKWWWCVHILQCLFCRQKVLTDWWSGIDYGPTGSPFDAICVGCLHRWAAGGYSISLLRVHRPLLWGTNASPWGTSHGIFRDERTLHERGNGECMIRFLCKPLWILIDRIIPIGDIIWRDIR